MKHIIVILFALFLIGCGGGGSGGGGGGGGGNEPELRIRNVLRHSYGVQSLEYSMVREVQDYRSSVYPNHTKPIIVHSIQSSGYSSLSIDNRRIDVSEIDGSRMSVYDINSIDGSWAIWSGGHILQGLPYGGSFIYTGGNLVIGEDQKGDYVAATGSITISADFTNLSGTIDGNASNLNEGIDTSIRGSFVIDSSRGVIYDANNLYLYGTVGGRSRVEMRGSFHGTEGQAVSGVYRPPGTSLTAGSFYAIR